jgi:hypothetical protein
MANHRKIGGRVLAFLLSAIMVPLPCATDAPLVGDAHVLPSFPTVNFGSISKLYVRNGSRALMQFDLSSVPAGTTATQLARANLRSYVNRVCIQRTKEAAWF